MRKVLSIALIVLTATVAVPMAHADKPLGEQIIAQEKALGARSEALNEEYGLGAAGEAVAAAKNIDREPASPTAVQQILRQERARAGDPALFGHSRPVQVVGSPDDFDFRDAGIGGAMGIALALLAAAGLSLRDSGRRGHPESASVGT